MEQDKYQQMQMFDYQIKQLQKVVESIDTQLVEIGSTIEALNGFSGLENGSQVLFPVANGIFAKGTLTDNTTLRINVGSDVVVEKSVADTIRMMEGQARDIGNYKGEVMAQLQKLIDAMNSLQGGQADDAGQ